MRGIYRAFDSHAHFNHGSPFDSPVGYAGIPAGVQRLDLPSILGEYARIGILGGGFSTFASVMEHPECVEEENEYLFNLAKERKQVRQWVVVDPRKRETFSQADAMLDSKNTLGIKIHPVYHGYDVTEYADKIFSFAAARRAVVLMHPQSIERMPEFADRYPDMTLIIAHLNDRKPGLYLDAIRAAKNGNLYTDTSGGSLTLNYALEYAVEAVGADKILFGTDTYSCGLRYGRIAFSDLSEDDKKKIFFDNALRLFPRALEEYAE